MMQTISVDCEMGDWTEWTVCSKSCKGGIKTRSRNVTQQPMHNGLSCSNSDESKDCNTKYCAGVNQHSE